MIFFFCTCVSQELHSFLHAFVFFSRNPAPLVFLYRKQASSLILHRKNAPLLPHLRPPFPSMTSLRLASTVFWPRHKEPQAEDEAEAGKKGPNLYLSHYFMMS